MEVVLQWECLKIVTKIKSFVRLVGYYRRFIEDFSKIVAPLTQLTIKEHPFIWMEKCEKSFKELKRRLTNAHVLTITDINQPFVVFCDASYQALDYVLMHNKKVVAYASWQLKLHERNYLTHNLELTAVIFSLKIRRHYLYGSSFKVFNDLKSLRYLFYQS